MDDKQMREAFEADFFGVDFPKDRIRRLGDGYALASAACAWTTWKAACRFAYAAGMERAAVIASKTQAAPEDWTFYGGGNCADAIRAEIPGGRNG